MKGPRILIPVKPRWSTVALKCLWEKMFGLHFGSRKIKVLAFELFLLNSKGIWQTPRN